MKKESVCPWWMGYLLLLPLRKLAHNPKKILQPYITEGMKVIDYGSAMGYFSLPMAEMVGKTGKVYCFDIQEKMLEQLMARGENADLEERLKPVLLSDKKKPFPLKEAADFGLLFAVAHEVPDQEKLFMDLAEMLKPNAKLLFAEPKGHVSKEAFQLSISLAEKAGFTQKETPKIGKGYAVLLEKA